MAKVKYEIVNTEMGRVITSLLPMTALIAGRLVDKMNGFENTTKYQIREIKQETLKKGAKYERI